MSVRWVKQPSARASPTCTDGVASGGHFPGGVPIVSEPVALTVEWLEAADGSTELKWADARASMNVRKVYVPGSSVPLAEFPPRVPRNTFWGCGLCSSSRTSAAEVWTFCPAIEAEPLIW